MSLNATHPVSVWNRPLRFNFGALFAALGKGVIDFAKGLGTDQADFKKDLVDAAAAVGLAREPGEVAWLLVRRALDAALARLVRDHLNVLAPIEDPVRLKAVSDIDATLADVPVHLDASFFREPERLEVLKAIEPLVVVWLQEHALIEARARSVAARLPAYFVRALAGEWQARAGEYEVLRAAISHPFADAEQRTRDWDAYRQLLRFQPYERVLDDTFSLNQIYQPLRASVGQPCSEEGDSRIGPPESKRERRKVVDLMTAVIAWLEQADRQDPIRLVSGGPGSGKSSFARMLAARLALEGRRVLLVPLHLFNVGGDVSKGIENFARLACRLGHDPLVESGRLVIIFDGLDELVMQGRAAQALVGQFLDEVRLLVGQVNLDPQKCLQLLLLGREVVVQANASSFRRPGQILEVLSYHMVSNQDPEQRRVPRTSESFIDPQGLLEQDQRTAWWQRYAQLTGQAFSTLPEVLTRGRLDEVTAQPLLNYLVALSYVRGRIDFTSPDINLNDVYADLIQSVYERTYGGHGTHPAVRGVSLPDFQRFLEVTAVAAWHGTGRAATVKDIEAGCPEPLKKKLAALEKAAENSVSQLLAAFYFRQFGEREGDRTFEFTHKSFGEYLVARALFRLVQQLQNDFDRYEDGDSGRSVEDCLAEWVRVAGPTAIDPNTFQFLVDEARRHGLEQARKFQVLLAAFVSHALAHELPVHRLSPRPAFRVELSMSRNANEALLATLNATARRTKELSSIQHPDPGAFAAWLAPLQGARRYLSFLDLRGIVLSGADLNGANLSGSDLRDAQLVSCRMNWAELVATNLAHATLMFSYMWNTDLTAANLDGADLWGVTLLGADMRGARLKRVRTGSSRRLVLRDKPSALIPTDFKFTPSRRRRPRRRRPRRRRLRRCSPRRRPVQRRRPQERPFRARPS